MPPTDPGGQHKKRDDVAVCGFEGNSDIYGLGIRIGAYAQTFASWIGSELVRHDLSELNAVTSLFMSAVLVSLVWVSSKRDIHAIEAFIMLHMMLVSWFTGPSTRFKSRLLSHGRGAEGEILNRFLKVTILVYNIWFWWVELDRLAPTPCGTYGLFFAYKFDMYGTIRVVNKVISILAIVVESRRTVFYIVGAVTTIRARKLHSNDMYNIIEREALIRNIGTGDLQPKNSTMVTVKEMYEPHAVPTKLSHHLRRRWSIGSIHRSKAVDQKADPPDFRLSQPQVAALAWTKGPILFHVLEADYFIEETRRKAMQAQKELVITGASFGGSAFTFVSFSKLNRAYWLAFWRLIGLLISKPRKIQSLIVVFLAYDLEAIERRTHDTPFVILAILQHSRFFDLDWKYFHIAAQLRATRACRTRLDAFVWWEFGTGLFICVYQVVAIELIIVWNRITGLQTLSSVGQLLPFIIGCGGLFRMLYVEIKRIYKHGQLFINANNGEESSSCSWADAYYEWKEQHQRFGWATRGSARLSV